MVLYLYSGTSKYPSNIDFELILGNRKFWGRGYPINELEEFGEFSLQSDPKFARTRENIAEFSRSGSGTKLLRTAFRTLIKTMADGRATSRLTRQLMKVIQADKLKARGQRNASDGDPALLEGFEFNDNAKLLKTFFAPFTTSIDRATGILLVDIPEFVPGDMIAWPEGATHVRLKAGGAAIDFETGTYAVTTSQSADIELGQQLQAALQLSQAVPAASESPLFLVFGIEFLQLVNDVQYPLQNGLFNALAIVKVDKPAA